MNYVSLSYYVFIIVLLILYYVLPKKYRWLILLSGSAYFYYTVIENRMQLAIFAVSIVVSYEFGLLIYKQRHKKHINPHVRLATLWTGIIISALPLIASKAGDFICGSVIHKPLINWIVPVGLAFYSMQMVAYLIDVYRGSILPQKDIFKYTLFTSFFPIIIQGPISRYNQLEKQLIEGHAYDIKNIMKGIQLVIWGFFLKMMIVDKAAVIVNAIFDNYQSYSGFYVLVAAVLYSIQLYADFMSCVTISQGTAQMFGINIIDNFYHPYFSPSVKEFWRRWHISLSSWLRDYVYIPLGGNRKGKISKYCNLIITFAVSGLWHGGRWKFLFWGILHAMYQIAGELTYNLRNRCFEKIQMPKDCNVRKIIETVFTFFFVMTAWIIFRAESLKTGIKMIINMFNTFNPWIFFDNSLFRLGLGQKEWEVLFMSIVVLFTVSFIQEKGIKIREWFAGQHLVVRWVIYLCAIWSIWIFGTYGFGFNAQDFIYGGF